jgi:hypothetical protein
MLAVRFEWCLLRIEEVLHIRKDWRFADFGKQVTNSIEIGSHVKFQLSHTGRYYSKSRAH